MPGETSILRHDFMNERGSIASIVVAKAIDTDRNMSRGMTLRASNGSFVTSAKSPSSTLFVGFK